MRATTTIIAAAAIAAPLLVSATPSPSHAGLYAREEFAPYVSARDVHDAAAIFRRGGAASKLQQLVQTPLSQDGRKNGEEDDDD
ncbi:uncharacterized protein FIBRA_06586 [Fibroporia radiculosa]|uniref:Uncharacterized protein n=1 Tax=Fibroporia radiculosa TaxID=599839 RepID=J4H456_9APHY|nr:uncharacterized protein FIBRA_06586 [Fibroporia radiculosa]CCM04409.1 predicted protein [Fibroporia radiculosa]